MQPLSNFTAGEFTTAISGDLITHTNPSDINDVVSRVPVGHADDARDSIGAASEALEAWRGLTGAARAEYLFGWSTVVQKRSEELAQAMVREVGKPLGEARGEVGRCVVLLRYYAGEAVREVGEVIPAQTVGAIQFTLREPLGVCALITPWNFPLAIPIWKSAPALAFGNTVVLKPSEYSSMCAVLLAETARDAGIPPGVFNVLLGTGAGVGDALVSNGLVRGISFTGSEVVGKHIATLATERNVRYQTEMGGKNVVIVASDANIVAAAALTASGAMRFAGQKCTATSRAVVLRDVENAFLDELRVKVDALQLGPVADAATAVGPLIHRRAMDRVIDMVRNTVGEIIMGGSSPTETGFEDGCFVQPTIIRCAGPDSPIVQEEVFGPVLATMVADSMDEAIELANRTRFGLSASLFTGNVKEMLSYISRIEAGLVRVNGDTTGVDPHAPFGGTKGSSSGSREQGRAAREFYTESKTVQINP